MPLRAPVAKAAKALSEADNLEPTPDVTRGQVVRSA